MLLSNKKSPRSHFVALCITLRAALGACVLSCLLVGCSQRPAPLPQAPSEVPKSEVSFTPKKSESWVLPNGLTVVFLEDREIPLVQGKL